LSQKIHLFRSFGVVVDVLDNPLEDVDVFEPKAELLALLNEL